MLNLKPIKPSFTLGYWRPWNENSNYFDSYCNYIRDISLEKYGADVLGNYISHASEKQVRAIEKMREELGKELHNISKELNFINRKLDLQIEQQRLSNILLKDIGKILKVPDSEKERLFTIELGVKFLTKASKDPDLYTDALDEFLKAENMYKQDYFVLYRIGCIYLYVENHLDPKKALEYFIRSAKYASVDSDLNISQLVEGLNIEVSGLSNREVNENINLIVSESFEKAAFASYVLGDFEQAVKFQEKSLLYNPCSEYQFTLSKYKIRNGQIEDAIEILSRAINENPKLFIAALYDLDLINQEKVQLLLENKNDDINKQTDVIIEKYLYLNIINKHEVIQTLSQSKEFAYDKKVAFLNESIQKLENTNIGIETKLSEIDKLIDEIKNSIFCTLKNDDLENILLVLQELENKPYEIKIQVLNEISEKVKKDKLICGVSYKGGIVFYLDSSKKHGMVFAETKIPKARFGGIKLNTNGLGAGIDIDTSAALASGGSNTDRLIEYASWDLDIGLFSTKKVMSITAARLCRQFNGSGFTDWFLPSLEEMKLIRKVYIDTRKGSLLNDYFWTSTIEKGHEPQEFNGWSGSSQWIFSTQERYSIPARFF
jgi:tetratricopeptide (TPR) repeat protein